MSLHIVGKPVKPDPNQPAPACGVICDYGIVAAGSVRDCPKADQR